MDANPPSPPPQPLRVVVVTMDSHVSGALSRAQTALQAELPGLTIAVHAADEWGHDPALLAECRADIAQGDIVVATMLFLDDHIRDVLPALTARRETCDAMVCCVSSKEVVRLTKLGRVDMSVEATGALAMLKRLRPSRKGGPGSSGEKQMRMLRRLPKLLRFIPGSAQDMRSYFLAMQYWLAGSEQNLANMVRLLAERYAAGPRQVAQGSIQTAAPIDYPDVGLYHPDLPGGITADLSQLPNHAGPDKLGTVGLLVMRSYVIAGNAAHYDGVIAAMEARGLHPITAFASGLDQRPAIEQYFIRDGAPAVDAVVSLTGFSLVGGPAYNDAQAAQKILAAVDVPYVAATAVEFQTLEQWQADARGLTPVEATMMVAIPELDGAIMSTVIGGRSTKAGGDKHDMVANMERAARLAARMERLVRLRRTRAAPPCHRPVQLPPQRRQQRHRRLSRRVRLPAQHAHRIARSWLHHQRPTRCGSPARSRHHRQRPPLRRARQRCSPHPGR
jgi:magnesium chelatase subunit H